MALIVQNIRRASEGWPGPKATTSLTNNCDRKEGSLDGLRLAQVPQIICAKFKTARTRFNVAALAKPTSADLDRINSSTPFATVLNGGIS